MKEDSQELQFMDFLVQNDKKFDKEQRKRRKVKTKVQPNSEFLKPQKSAQFSKNQVMAHAYGDPNQNPSLKQGPMATTNRLLPDGGTIPFLYAGIDQEKHTKVRRKYKDILGDDSKKNASNFGIEVKYRFGQRGIRTIGGQRLGFLNNEIYGPNEMGKMVDIRYGGMYEGSGSAGKIRGGQVQGGGIGEGARSVEREQQKDGREFDQSELFGRDMLERLDNYQADIYTGPARRPSRIEVDEIEPVVHPSQKYVKDNYSGILKEISQAREDLTTNLVSAEKEPGPNPETSATPNAAQPRTENSKRKSKSREPRSHRVNSNHRFAPNINPRPGPGKSRVNFELSYDFQPSNSRSNRSRKKKKFMGIRNSSIIREHQGKRPGRNNGRQNDIYRYEMSSVPELGKRGNESFSNHSDSRDSELGRKITGSNQFGSRHYLTPEDPIVNGSIYRDSFNIEPPPEEEHYPSTNVPKVHRPRRTKDKTYNHLNPYEGDIKIDLRGNESNIIDVQYNSREHIPKKTIDLSAFIQDFGAHPGQISGVINELDVSSDEEDEEEEIDPRERSFGDVNAISVDEEGAMQMDVFEEFSSLREQGNRPKAVRGRRGNREGAQDRQSKTPLEDPGNIGQPQTGPAAMDTTKDPQTNPASQNTSPEDQTPNINPTQESEHLTQIEEQINQNQKENDLNVNLKEPQVAEKLASSKKNEQLSSTKEASLNQEILQRNDPQLADQTPL